MTDQIVHTGKVQPIRKFLSPFLMVRDLWRHRELTWNMAKREIVGRYRTAHLGLLWSILTPLALLVTYTFVFTVIFKARWQQDVPESRGQFALTMFCGMLLYNFFAEVVNKAPDIVVTNPNYVKRVVFPLEIFIISGLISALFNMMIGYGVWLIGWFSVQQTALHWTALWLPVVIIPACLTTAGLAWLLASLGVFVRDVGHAVVIITQILFFATPIFYRIEVIPYPYRTILELNPLAHAIEDVRRVLMWNQQPRWDWWCASLVVSFALALLGYAFFMKSKRAFADVV